MRELHFFRDPGNPHISVALAGINKLEWVSIDEAATIDEAARIMSENRFDILPITSGEACTHCYKTIIWGKYAIDNVEKHEITREERLYYLTSIEDVINQFAITNRKYFFLDNFIEIVGLLSIGNLNCKHVYVYLYNQVIQLEHKLGSYVYGKGVTDKELVQLFETKTDSSNAVESLDRYRNDDAEAMDYNFLEYIYLTDFRFIFKHFDFTKNLNLSNKVFTGMLISINEIRRVVAHPNKSLIRNDKSIHKVNEAIRTMDILLEKINAINSDSVKA